MTKALILTIPFVLLACGADAFTSTSDMLPTANVPETGVAETSVSANNDAGSLSTADAGSSQDGQADSPADAPHEAADCSSCPNTDNSNCKALGGWTGNMCPCECFVGLTQQAIDHCGQKGCVCEDSAWKMQPGLSCIKTAP